MNVHAKDLQGRSDGGHKASSALKRVLSRMPDEVRAGFTAAQLAAIDAALDFNNPKRHPINFRVTLFGRAFLVVLGGREQRTPERRAEERKRHPLSSPGNVAFMFVLGCLGLGVGYALRVLLMEG